MDAITQKNRNVYAIYAAFGLVIAMVAFMVFGFVSELSQAMKARTENPIAKEWYK